MKKLIFFTAVIAALFTGVSCKKGDSDSAGKLPEPSNTLHARKMYLDNNFLNIYSMEFTEAGRYIVTNKKIIPALTSFSSRANKQIISYQQGTYTFQSNTYNLADYGTAAINQNKVRVTLLDGRWIEVEFTETEPAPATDIIANMSRSWKVNNVRVSVNLDGSVVTVTKRGGNLAEIAGELYQKGVDLDVDQVDGYVIDEVTFTRAKTFAIMFTDKDPYVGEYNLDKNNGFTYDFEGNAGNTFFTTQGDGKVEYNSESKQLVVTLNASIQKKNSSSSYSGSVILYLSEA